MDKLTRWAYKNIKSVKTFYSSTLFKTKKYLFLFQIVA